MDPNRRTSTRVEDDGNKFDSSSIAGDGDGDRPGKRRRVALACNRCRKQKSRCDGAQPHCSVCTALGYDCSYPSNETAAQRRETTDDLKDQLHAMEQRLRALEAATHDRPDPAITPYSVASRRDGLEDPGISTFRQSETTNETISAEMTESRTEDLVDSMGTIKPAAEVNAGFFGPSSNIAFMDHIWNAIVASSQQTTGSTQMQSDTDAAILNVSRTYRSSKELDEQDLFAFPSEADTQRLFSHYFENTGLLFPYVHEASMYETYAQSRANGFRGIKLSWLALFNMVLAQGNSTRTDDVNIATERIGASDVFYHRALGLSRLQDMHGANVETVQYLLLMVQYLQSTQRSSHVWTVYGSAVKAAFSIGLHSEMASRKCSPLEQEIRKRTWYGCVILDRTLGMTLGRPASIPQHYVRLSLPKPFPPDNPTISENLTTPEVAILSMQFFTGTVELYSIMWSVLDDLYGQNMGLEPTEPLSTLICHIIRLDERLQLWQANLPPSLRTTESSIPALDLSTRIPQRLQSILTLRYLNTRLLLHRPVLAHLLDNNNNNNNNINGYPSASASGMHTLATASVSAALGAATQIIGIVHAHGERKAALGAWWFSLYYTFNGALVIFALSFLKSRFSHYSPSSSTSCSFSASSSSSSSFSPCTKVLDKAQLRNTFSLAIQALGVIDRGNPIVERCRRYLGKLLELRVFDEPVLLRERGVAVQVQQQQQQAQGESLALGQSRSQGQQQDGGIGVGSQDAQPLLAGDGNAPAFEWGFDGEMGMEMGEYMREGHFGLFGDLFGPS